MDQKPLDLDALAALLERATPGEWYVGISGDDKRYKNIWCNAPFPVRVARGEGQDRIANAQFILEWHNHAADLIERVRRCESALKVYAEDSAYEMTLGMRPPICAIGGRIARDALAGGG